MNENTESVAQGPIDLTMMYAVHDAFRRDLARLLSCVDSDDPLDRAAVAASWPTVKSYLMIHHTAEDRSLWPVMRTKLVGRSAQLALLDTMAAEHARLDPILDRIDTALAGGGERPRLREDVADLSRSTLAHFEHEEAEALPLLQAVLTQDDWDAFGAEQRRRVGIRGAATFFPWLLDEAPEATRRKVLGLVPAPLRVIYRWIWQPRYERRSPWRRKGRTVGGA